MRFATDVATPERARAIQSQAGGFFRPWDQPPAARRPLAGFAARRASAGAAIAVPRAKMVARIEVRLSHPPRVSPTAVTHELPKVSQSGVLLHPGA